MTKLNELAYVIRSKNAGPFEVTFDILFKDETLYQRVKDTGVINAKLFSRMYGVPEKDCNYVEFDYGWALKCTIVRPIPAGDVFDPDVYGCQQYVGLLDVDIPIEA